MHPSHWNSHLLPATPTEPTLTLLLAVAGHVGKRGILLGVAVHKQVPSDEAACVAGAQARQRWVGGSLAACGSSPAGAGPWQGSG